MICVVKGMIKANGTFYREGAVLSLDDMDEARAIAMGIAATCSDEIVKGGMEESDLSSVVDSTGSDEVNDRSDNAESESSTYADVDHEDIGAAVVGTKKSSRSRKK